MGVKTYSFFAVLLLGGFLVNGYVISSPLDDVDKCIYTCDYCFKGRVVVKCANDCLLSNGKMIALWLKTCPEFSMPLYFSVDMNAAENDLKINEVINNNLH